MNNSSQNRKSIASGTIAINRDDNNKSKSSTKTPQTVTKGSDLKKTTSPAPNNQPIKSIKKTPSKSQQQNDTTPQNSQSSNFTPPPHSPPSYSTPPPYNNYNQSTGWNNPSNNNWNNPPGSMSNPTSQNLTMDQKIEIIKTLFKEVLGREATDKDINYYKYGVVTEDSLRKKLVAGKEHTELVKNGSTYKDLKEAYDKLLVRVNQYESKIKDHIEEFKKMKNVFDEKNRYIQQLRSQIKNYPQDNNYAIQTPYTQQPQQSTTNLQPVTQNRVEYTNTNAVSKNSPQFLLDNIKDLIKSLFDF